MSKIVRKIAIVSAAVLTMGAAAQASTVSFVQGATESNAAQLFAEKSNVAVDDGSVFADYVVGANLNVGDTFRGIDNATSRPQAVSAGSYDSHLIHFDPLTRGGETSGSFSFAGKIVALIVSNGAGSGNFAQLLNDSDAVFGIGTYEQSLSRRSENHEVFTLSSANTLFFNFKTSGNYIDNVRVITEVSAVPLPAGAALLLTGLGAFGAMRRKARGQA